MNLAKNLERSAFYFGDRPAVSESGREISYAELNARANRIATSLLKMNVRGGERVGICAPNSAAWLSFYFGVLKAGATAVTLSPFVRKGELELLIGHSRPKILFTAEDKLDHLKDLRKSGVVEKIVCQGGDLTLESLVSWGDPAFEAVDRERTDTAAILYTGGTTGIPKGVM
jgi:long-chain acyl-CoA synthetase